MTETVPLRRAWVALALALAIFAAGFAVADRFQLTHGVLYRAAANDWPHAARNFSNLALQALALFASLMLIGRRMFAAAMMLVFVSVLANLAYGQTVNDVIGPGTVAWLGAEARQAGSAAGEFAAPLLLAAVQAAVAIALIVAARAVLAKGGWIRSGRLATASGVTILLAPSVLAATWGAPPAAERNLYSLGLEVALADPPPPREQVEWTPQTDQSPRHIVWLVDESVAYPQFEQIVAPKIASIDHLDFGMTAALGHCSAPANLALRSGVNVRRAGPGMDLRTTPSIWGYAQKAGYRTMLIDGQTSGPPQNIMLPPERALIDEAISVAGDYDTDREIARIVNRQLRGPQRSFTYVVLRGVHFQYRDHFPAGLIPAASSNLTQYETALAYSKARFFDFLLAFVDREQVAVVYTSDHGQNLTPGAIPHCSSSPQPTELHIPLLAFLPDGLVATYDGAPRSGHAASQIFPATLIWMGYDRDKVQRQYDNDLNGLPARYVRFDRKVVPLRFGDPIDLAVSNTLPR